MKLLLSDEQWKRLAPLFDGNLTQAGSNNRQFVEAVLWYIQSGKPWKRMPKYYGNWNSVYIRFSRWKKYGLWDEVFKILKMDADFEERYLDPDIISSHRRKESIYGGKNSVLPMIEIKNINL